MPNVETDVLIVGGGPVGLSLAGDLGSRGIPCILLEKTDGAIFQPKMDGVNVRTMEFCRRWGITDDVRNCGYPKEFPQDMVYLTSFDGFELGREEFVTPSGGAEERRLSTSPESRFRCPQNLFDPILRKFAARQPSVELRYLSTLIDCVEHADHVMSNVEDARSNKRYQVVSRYVVGCDGAASCVREGLAIGMSGLGTLTYTTNVLFRCAALRDASKIRLGYRHLLIGPEGTWGTIVAINGRDEWRLSIIGGRERVKPTESDVRAAIERAIGLPLEYEVLTIVPWTRKELVADKYGASRIYIAGDAAHVTSPTGGFGMNMGIADAVDLSWKLEATLAGWGGSKLLDSYEVERRPVALRTVREATGNLLRTLSPGSNPLLLNQSYEGALVRSKVGAQFSATMLREWYKLGMDLGYVYRDSPVIVHSEGKLVDTRRNIAATKSVTPPDGYFIDGRRITPTALREWQRLSMHLALGSNVELSWEALPAHEVMLYQQSAEPGARAPHVWIDDNTSTLDWFGKGFALVSTGNNERGIDAMTQAARQYGMPLEVKHAIDDELRLLYAAPLVLVRPDGHVAWRGNVASAERAQSIINQVRGA